GEVCRNEVRIGGNAGRHPDIGEPQPIGVGEERRQPRAHVARRAGDQYFLHVVSVNCIAAIFSAYASEADPSRGVTGGLDLRVPPLRMTMDCWVKPGNDNWTNVSETRSI